MKYTRPTDGLDKDARLHIEGGLPTDIMREASKWTAKCSQPETGTWFDVRDNIASAILSERQRCADVATNEGNGYRDNNLSLCAMGAYQASKAILSGKAA